MNGQERQLDNSCFSRACLLIHFLVNLNWGLSRNATIAPKSPKGELGLLRLVSPVAYRTPLGPHRCRSIRNCGGNSLKLNQSPCQPFSCPLCALQTSQRGFNPGIRAQVHPLPPPATVTWLFRKFSSAYSLQEQGQSHGGRDPLASCLMTAAGVIIPG